MGATGERPGIPAPRLKTRLAEAIQLDPLIETTNGMPNRWPVRLFVAP